MTARWLYCMALVTIVLLPGTRAVSHPAHPQYAFSWTDLLRPAGKPRPLQTLTCPTDLKTLTQEMLADLPAYMNRLNRRLVGRKPIDSDVYAIVASQPDFQPIPIEGRSSFNPQDPGLHQIFFTVLERQYSGKQVFEWQDYYWLFMTQTEQGWQLAMLFSRLGTYPADDSPVTQLRESSQGITAQAIRTWLRDCQAGTVRR